MAQQQHNPDLLSRLISDLILVIRLMFDRRVSSTAKLIPLVLLVYVISPVDLIPDMFVPLGIVDDITLLVIGLQLFIHLAPRDVVQEYRQGRKKRAAPRRAPQPRKRLRRSAASAPGGSQWRRIRSDHPAPANRCRP